MEKKAFTLAEILITLSILGVVAAITIPTIINKNSEKITVAKVKKIYATLNNAFLQSILDNGKISTWNLGEQASEDGSSEIANKLVPYLQTTYISTANNNKVFSKYGYKTLNKNGSCIHPYSAGSTKVILKDGASLNFFSFGQESCKGIYHQCGIIFVDINGPKGPNMLGNDTFSFWIVEKDNTIGDTILGYNNKIYCSYETDPTCQNGLGCTHWVLTKGNMDYLRRDVSSEW